MEYNNNLSGLTSDGFQNYISKFDSAIFEKKENIELCRQLIRKYFTKTKTICRSLTNVDIIGSVRQNLGTYVYYGEFIYAMHLEGYKLERINNNCYFNIKAKDCEYIMYGKLIIEKLSEYNEGFTRHVKLEKKFLKYKYHIKFLAICTYVLKFKENDILKIISKEINESYENVKCWANLLKDDPAIIPKEKINLLEKIFNIPKGKLLNIEKE